MASPSSSPAAPASGGPALPRITIQFCTQCKWMLRAAYFAQELLSTFSTALYEVALQPTTGGVFRVEMTAAAASQQQQARSYVLWDRKTEGGFPETKELKRRVRDVIDPGRDLGHVDRDYHRPAPAVAPPPPSAAPAASEPEGSAAPGIDAAASKLGGSVDQPASPAAAVAAVVKEEPDPATTSSPSPPDLAKVTPTQLAAAAMGVPLYLLRSGGNSSGGPETSAAARGGGGGAEPLPQAPHGVKPQIQKPPAEYTAEIQARLDERNRLKAELEGGDGAPDPAAETDKCEDCD